MTVNPQFVCIEMVYLGYITQNWIELRFMINDQDQTSKMLAAHHIMVVIGCLTGLYGGYATPGVSNIACLCEISAIFLNYRGMWTKDEMNDCLPTINQLCFFFAYLIFRIFLFPFCVYLLILSLSYTWHIAPMDRKLCSLFAVSLYQVVIVMNFYWFYLILKGLKRLLQEQGVLKRPVKFAEDEQYNFGVEDTKKKK